MRFDSFLVKLRALKEISRFNYEPLSFHAMQNRLRDMLHEATEVSRRYLGPSFYAEMVEFLTREPSRGNSDIIVEEEVFISCFYVMGLKNKFNQVERCLLSFSPFVRCLAIRTLSDMVRVSQNRYYESKLERILTEHLENSYEASEVIIEIAVAIEELPCVPLSFSYVARSMKKSAFPEYKLLASNLLKARLVRAGVDYEPYRNLLLEYPRKIIEMGLDQENWSCESRSITRFRFRKYVENSLESFMDGFAEYCDMLNMLRLFNLSSSFKDIRRSLLDVLEHFSDNRIVFKTILSGLNDENLNIRTKIYEIVLVQSKNKESFRRLIEDFVPLCKASGDLKNALLDSNPLKDN